MKYQHGKHPNSVPVETKSHPWRKRNNCLKDYSLKAMVKKRESKKANA